MGKIVSTSCGKIEGTSCRWPGVAAFKGIRYATAGRWEYPKQVTEWEGTYQADQYGNCCYQPRAFYDEAKMPEKAFYYKEFRQGETYTYSEDCLFLNIWTPENAEETDRRPVIFYIHGGGFTGGCGHEKHFDGPVWSCQGAVSVTINYRLGPLGFAALPELAEEAGTTGDYGLMDQICALKWVHDNIAAFGGDPDNITIMGQSAGAMSVQILCVSPLTDGLIAKAVMSSGGGVNKLMPDTTASQLYPIWQAIMAQAGCKTIAEFRAISATDLFAAWNAVKTQNKMAALACFPCIDGRILPEGTSAIAAEGKQKNIPYIMGSNSEDIAPPMIYQMATDWCRLEAEQGKMPCYAYHFDRKLPGDEEGAWHSADLWYWFGTLENCWRPFHDRDRELSAQMAAYLVNFAATGNPNNPAGTESSGSSTTQTETSESRTASSESSGSSTPGSDISEGSNRNKKSSESSPANNEPPEARTGRPAYSLPIWNAYPADPRTVSCILMHFSDENTEMGIPDMNRLQWNMKNRHPVGE